MLLIVYAKFILEMMQNYVHEYRQKYNDGIQYSV